MMPDFRLSGDLEGYRLWWFHRMRRAELDLAARSWRLQRAEGQLRWLQEQLRPPRSRPRAPGKAQELVTKILQGADVIDGIGAEVHTRGQEIYRQQKRGRPSRNTVYVKKVPTRLDLNDTIDAEQVSRPRDMDGIFPLVTNDTHLDALEVRHASKRQPQIEKRFAKLKTDFPCYVLDLRPSGNSEKMRTQPAEKKIYWVVWV